MAIHHVIGLLSGSSLDGIDIVCCRFEIDHSFQFNGWQLLCGETVPFSNEWKSKLKALPTASAKEFIQADADLGHLFGVAVREFIQKNKLPPIDLVASHGHTIFHFPQSHVTTQIADGAAIVSECNIDTVTQLRSMDIAYNGQGAPMAPLGDKFLLPAYDFYLNLGGIANVTFIEHGNSMAYDITTCNQILNGLADLLDLEYDKDGLIARSGICNQDLLNQLLNDTYHTLAYPKSLDNTWSQIHHVIPTIQWKDSVPNKLNTSVEFISIAIANDINALIDKNKRYTMVATGGGAMNIFLIERLQAHLPQVQIILPEADIISFKEAAFMALAGLYRKLGIVNIFSSVTGAQINTINGALYSSQLAARI